MATKRPACVPPALNEAHVTTLTHHFIQWGIRQEVAEKLSLLLGNGLWNNQQDDLLAMMTSCERAPSIDTERVGLGEVDSINRRTERAHATFFYHSLSSPRQRVFLRMACSGNGHRPSRTTR